MAKKKTVDPAVREVTISRVTPTGETTERLPTLRATRKVGRVRIDVTPDAVIVREAWPSAYDPYAPRPSYSGDKQQFVIELND